MEIETAVSELKLIGLFVISYNQNLIFGSERGEHTIHFGQPVTLTQGYRFNITSEEAMKWKAVITSTHIPGHGPCEREFSTLQDAVAFVCDFFKPKRTFNDGSMSAKAALVRLRSDGISAKFSHTGQGCIYGGIGPIDESGYFIQRFSISRQSHYYIVFVYKGRFQDPLLTFTKSLSQATEAVCDFYKLLLPDTTK
ncbi:MAG: hypothetical protein IT324_26450 [Anaerolineae bacterium]|nr:hypothetical protein [Anaerolineae bacterium]